jgi:DNA-binding transcriptional LysR family regulator
MELVDLRVFVSVVENGGITKAANSLNRVPSSVTTRILQLEDSLGIKLFLREGKRLLITSEGRTLYEYALRILQLVREAEHQLKNTELAGLLRLGAMESTAAARLATPLARLYKNYPRIEVELITGSSRSLYEELLSNRLDVALIADAYYDQRFDYLEIFTEELLIIAPEGHRNIQSPIDIQKKVALTFKKGCAYRKRLLDWFKASGSEPERVAELSSYYAILGGISAGMGIGIIPASTLATFSDIHTLSVHKVTPPHGRSVTSLTWRKGMFSANISALQRCLAQPNKKNE